MPPPPCLCPLKLEGELKDTKEKHEAALQELMSQGQAALEKADKEKVWRGLLAVPPAVGCWAWERDTCPAPEQQLTSVPMWVLHCAAGRAGAAAG